MPRVRSKELPGYQSAKLIAELKRFECPQITYIGGPMPVFLDRGHACNLFDVDGNRYLDLTASFAVAGLGHGPGAVTRAVGEQMKRMVQALGDVHPSELKVRLARKLSEITPGNLQQSIFSTTGSEAVESALKTAVIHTKKTGVIAFTGAYHGLGYGALAVTHREDFRKPFLKQLGGFVYHAPFPDEREYEGKAAEVSMKAVARIVKKNRRGRHPVGAVLIEPVQGRGGIRTAPVEFLKNLRAFCDAEKILLIADEVFTGFGRTGSMFAIEKSGIVPDLLCLGKGMANGFPVSACVGPIRIMYSWGASTGDAIHTSTFLGHPVGCAAALAAIQEIESKKLVDRSRQMGDLFRKELWKLKDKFPVIADIRGAGLMIGVELSETQTWGRKSRTVPATAKAKQFAAEALRHGLVLLLSGADHNVISITPPLIIGEREIQHTIKVFEKVLKSIP
ncbi:MAG: hypothetical protein A3D28_02075 [Omnitrophica bacterium RIFCSPHIGHO2_02_FULL_63_14]|nr:MAG: hypothetical protein A3D28_02075 [Omnitrophica bacterium RIFCSPHIGHO2_02_FULL_63_14]